MPLLFMDNLTIFLLQTGAKTDLFGIGLIVYLPFSVIRIRKWYLVGKQENSIKGHLTLEFHLP